MSTLEIIIYSCIGVAVITYMTFSIIDTIRKKQGKEPLFKKKKEPKDED